MIAGRDAPTHGEAKNSWLTGTAAWNFVAATQWIVGIRPELDGLRIDPCLPAGWGEVRVLRRFRGTTYRILIRPEAAGTGHGSGPGVVRRLTVDSEPIEGNLVPLPPAGTVEVTVEAILEPRVQVAA
jgi:cellobiose phosphorylase